MAKVWLSSQCPGCGKPVEEEGVLVAKVKLTLADTYGSYKSAPGQVRPNFTGSGERHVWHSDCFDAMIKAVSEK